MKNLTATMRRRTINPLVQTFKLEVLENNRPNVGKPPLISPIISPKFEPKKQKTPNSLGGLFPEARTPNTPARFAINVMDEIIPNLWLGKIICEEEILHHNFTHVLSIIDKKPDFFDSPDFTTKWIDIKDDGSENISDYFEDCSEFIHNALLSSGKIYVHCQYGFSRSPTIVIAYIMQYGNSPQQECKMHFFDALEYVSSKRPSICPNFGFNMSLRNYERFLQDESVKN
jgi:hypothetical protein